MSHSEMFAGRIGRVGIARLGPLGSLQQLGAFGRVVGVDRAVFLVADHAGQHDVVRAHALAQHDIIQVGVVVEAVGEALADVRVAEEVHRDAVAVQLAAADEVVAAFSVDVEGEEHIRAGSGSQAGHFDQRLGSDRLPGSRRSSSTHSTPTSVSICGQSACEPTATLVRIAGLSMAKRVLNSSIDLMIPSS